MSKEFNLPVCWYVVVTEETLEICSRWRFNNNQLLDLRYDQIVGISKHNNSGEYRKGHNPKDKIKKHTKYGYDFGEEITFDQFKKYVLNQDEENLNYLADLLKKLNIK